MATKTMSDISDMMAKIDFCMLETVTDGGLIAARPMSNNGDVEYRGQTWFFSYEDSRKIRDIRAENRVSLSFQGSGGLLGLVGKPGAMIVVQGHASLIDDRETFAEHWVKDLEFWFEDGIDTPGMIMIRVDADRITYWDGMEQGTLTP